MFFDGPGGTQTPEPVTQAVADTMRSALSNRDRDTLSGRRADDIVLAARAAIADLLAVEPQTVVFGRSMTALTYDMARMQAAQWGPGDEVVVTSLDHDANISPWVQAADGVGATVKRAHFNVQTGELPISDVVAQITPRTRLVAVTAASNVIGTRPDIPAIAQAAHEVGALVYVDLVHLTPHAAIDVQALGADLVACSAYKFFGPHLGVLAGRAEVLQGLRPQKLLPSPDRIPERFELGTLPYAMLAGVTAAVDFIAGLDSDASGDRRSRLMVSYAALEGHEQILTRRLDAGLAEVEGLTSYSRAAHRTPTAYFSVHGVGTADLSQHCIKAGLNVPASHFYALDASRRLGLGDTGALRVGIAPYTTETEVDALLGAIAEGVEMLRSAG